MSLSAARSRAPVIRSLLVALGFVVLVNVVGSIPAFLAGPSSPWFGSLAKPALYPPPALFGIVWTLLFTLQGIALWLVWRGDGPRRAAFVAFGVQFVFNLLWTPAFFALHDLLVALGVIVVLWVAIVATIRAFDRVDRRAAALLVPYLLWVSFAAVLNYRFWVLNG